ncbi:MAG: DUF2125 domain-containing protein [Paracoccaceae bacterium]
MKHVTFSCSSAVLALLAATAPARADVTADQIWQQWKDFGASMGQTIAAATEDRSGDTLTLGGVTFDVPVEGGQAKGAIDQLVLTEAGDGSVTITMSPSYTVSVVTAPEGGQSTDMEMTVSQEGLAMRASGTPEATNYEVSADSVTATVPKLVVDGKPQDLVVDVSASALSGSYFVDGVETRKVDSAIKAGGVAISVSGTDPEKGGKIAFSMDLADLSGTSTGTYITGLDMSNLAEALNQGFTTTAMLNNGAMNFTMSVDEPGNAFQGSGTASSGDLSVRMDSGGLGYAGGAKNLDMVFSGEQIPLPQVAVTMQEYAYNFLMPVSKSSEPQDFALLTRIVGLAVGDDIWGMIDPGAVLPRDPATLIIDLKGKGNWLVDIMTPEATTTEGTPGELHALDVDELKLSVAGAELTGNGAFTFDNSDTTTFGGVPKPTGALDLMLVGGNTLMDKLVQMGLLPQDQAMGARMMMGLFAKPGDGEDTLVSKIEITPDGAVMANGQRLQ